MGNLPYTTTDEELEGMFSSHGEITRAVVVKDRDTGRSRGFGFVEMINDDEARTAIDAVNGTDIGGRVLTVNQARPRQPRAGGGGGGGGAGGGGGGGGGGGYGGGGGRY